MDEIKAMFKELRFDKSHHLGLGDIRLTIGQQELIESKFEELENGLKSVYKKLGKNQWPALRIIEKLLKD